MKRRYETPELSKAGTLTKLTKTVKQTGYPPDGIFLRNSGGTLDPLTGVS